MTGEPLFVTSRESRDTATEEPPVDFEKALAELEAIVERLEQGELSLEESMAQFERGIALTRACQAALGKAEQTVEILLRRAGQADEDLVAPFEPDAD